MDPQILVDTLGDITRTVRSEYHLTLGGAIKKLSNIEKTLTIMFDWNNTFPGTPISYRGYYSDLAFELSDKPITVENFLTILNASLGDTFEGYKGRDFKMLDDTPLWASNYGVCGRAIIDVAIDSDRILLITKELD